MGSREKGMGRRMTAAGLGGYILQYIQSRMGDKDPFTLLLLVPVPAYYL